jgi:hypothetical protein
MAFEVLWEQREALVRWERSRQADELYVLIVDVAVEVDTEVQETSLGANRPRLTRQVCRRLVLCSTTELATGMLLSCCAPVSETVKL